MKRGNLKYDLWLTIVKPGSIILGLIIFCFIIGEVFSLGSSITWGVCGGLSLLWIIYYFVFDFTHPDIRQDEELPDEV